MKNKKFVLALSLALVAVTGASVATGVAIHNNTPSGSTPSTNADVTVTWTGFDGGPVEEKYTPGKIARYKGALPTKASASGKGYFFKGWDPAPGVVTANTTYTAQFDEYTVKKKVDIIGDGFYIAEGDGSSGTYKKNFTKQYDYGSTNLTYTFVLDDSYGSRALPDKVKVMIGDEEAPSDYYTYTKGEDTATLTIVKLTDDIVVTASADKSAATFDFVIDATTTEEKDRTITFYTNEEVTVDWGDGIDTESVDGYSTHIYSAVEESTTYTVKITPILLGESNASTRESRYIRFTEEDATGHPAYADGNKKITNIKFYSYFEYIPDGAFKGLTSLSEVKLCREIEDIGDGAFEESGLTSIDFKYPIVNFGDFVFCRCDKLASVKLPKSLTTIPEATFYGCKSLTTINLGENITKTDFKAFAYSGLTSIDLCNVEEVGDSSFVECENLSQVIFTKTGSSGKIVKIKERAFDTCSSINSIVFPSTLKEIGQNAFVNCTNLKSIDCTALKDNVPTTEGFVFDLSVTDLKIKVKDATAKYAFDDAWADKAGVTKYQIICDVNVGINSPEGQYTLNGPTTLTTYNSYSGTLVKTESKGVTRFPSYIGFGVYPQMKGRDGTFAKLPETAYTYNKTTGAVTINEKVVENDVEIVASLDYKVKFDMGEGYKSAKVPADQYKLLGQTVTAPTAGTDYETSYTDETTGTTYNFKHFSKTAGGAAFDFNTKFVASDSDSLTLYAVWEAQQKTINITWKNYNGDVIGVNEKAYNIGATITYPEGEEKQGGGTFPAIDTLKPAESAQYTYSFDHWDGLPASVSEDTPETLTVIAIFKPTTKQYNITFDAGVGSWTKTSEKQVVLEKLDYGTSADAVKAALAAKDTIVDTFVDESGVEYTFKGWSPTVVAVTGATTYTAQYQATTQFTVTWKVGDAEDVVETYQKGATPVYTGTTPAHTKNSKEAYPALPEHDHVCYWTGWDKEIVPVTENVTYTATFDENVAIKFTGTDCTVNGKSAFTDSKTYGDGTSVYTIVPNEGKTLPDTITITLEDKAAVEGDYSYVKNADGTATLTIKHSLCNFVISVTAA